VIEEDTETEERGAVHVVEPTRIFEDAEERAMYMALPQLAEVVPSTLLGALADAEIDVWTIGTAIRTQCKTIRFGRWRCKEASVACA